MSLPDNELLQDIAHAAIRSSPEDWQRIILHTEALANTVEIGLTVTLADGTVTKKIRPESGLGATVGKLRYDMNEPSKGTWYLADFIVEGDEVNATFDYENPPFGGLIDDDDPDSEADADPELVLEDHRMFPRDEALLPDWHPARTAS